MSKQPKWQKVGAVGDVNPIDYDGGIVLEDSTGVYAPEVEYYERESDADNSKIRVYRFSADKCTFEGGILSDNPYHKDHAVWFADSIASIAAQYDRGVDFISMLCSDDTMKRAWAWVEVAIYHGFEELDSYPLTLTVKEAEKRIKRIK